MITIGLEGLRFRAFVGLHGEEQTLGNEIVIDIYVNVSSDDHDETNPVEGTVDYEAVYTCVKQVLSEKTDLLENLSKKILKQVSELSSRIEGIEIRVTKMHPPITGRIDRVFVEQEWVRGK